MADTVVTIIGNVVADPTLRFTKDGISVGDFTVASTPRIKSGGEWVDGETMFVRANLWRDLAEGAAESLRKGMRVIVTGKLKQTSYEAKDGSGKRTSLEIDADEVGISVRARREKAAATSNAGWGTANDTDSAPF